MLLPRSDDQTLKSQEKNPTLEKVLKLAEIKQALNFLKADNAATAKEQIQVTELAAPPFKEQMRADWMAEQFRTLGLADVTIDAKGNVLGELRGESQAPKVVLSAHLDTVFPAETSVHAKIKDGVIYAPGISDDGRGLASILTIIRAIRHGAIKPLHSLLFVATVGEEGLGDLRGVKALFKSRQDIGAFISIEPGNAALLTCNAVGSHRYRVCFKGPGGHSFAAFGLPSAIHAMGRAIAAVSDLQVPASPRTTFTIGKVSGGTSINTIAEDAEMLLDLRSESGEALLELENEALKRIRTAVEAENRRWGKAQKIQVFFTQIGDRPAGTQSSKQLIVQLASAAASSLGLKPSLKSSSTDSNVPISLGIPSVTMSGGGISGKEHTLEEFFDPKESWLGPQSILLTVLALTGVAGTTPSALF